MRATTLLLSATSLLALTPSAWAVEYGPCVETCITSHPILSSCGGNEKGKALDDCVCGSFIGGTQDPMIKCITKCPTDQQSQYASNLPAECRGTLFPGLKISSATTTGASGGATSSGGASPSQTSGSTSPTTTNGAVVNAPTQIAMVGAVLAGLLV